MEELYENIFRLWSCAVYQRQEEHAASIFSVEELFSLASA
jgi:hypothetical protein